jgi:hypothetical protein
LSFVHIASSIVIRHSPDDLRMMVLHRCNRAPSVSLKLPTDAVIARLFAMVACILLARMREVNQPEVLTAKDLCGMKRHCGTATWAQDPRSERRDFGLGTQVLCGLRVLAAHRLLDVAGERPGVAIAAEKPGPAVGP